MKTANKPTDLMLHLRMPKSLAAKIVQRAAEATIEKKKKVSQTQWIVETLEKAVQ